MREQEAIDCANFLLRPRGSHRLANGIIPACAHPPHITHTDDGFVNLASHLLQCHPRFWHLRQRGMIPNRKMEFAETPPKPTDPPLGAWSTHRQVSISALALSRANRLAGTT